jgi:NAD(P)-dependent dehydrogenase (short-subunit alcohol dehydrogenase family)
MRHQDWKRQNIVVTGAGSGLGRAICARFAPLAASVRGIDLQKAQLEEMRATLGDSFIPVICNVANWGEVARVFEQFPSVDVLVNCAGITGRTNVKSHETDPAEVEQVIRVNFFGSYHTSKAVLPQMARRGYGRLLHIASIAGKEGNAGMLAYSASKAAVIGMTKVQGKELAGTGVTVNALAPAVIQTHDGAGPPRTAGQIHDGQNPDGSLRDLGRTSGHGRVYRFSGLQLYHRFYV